MKLFSILFLLMSMNISDNLETRTQELNPFKNLIVENALTVELIPSGEDKIEISGVGARDVLLSSNKSSLKIYTGLNSDLVREDIQIKLYYTNLEEIQSKHHSRIFTSKLLKFKTLELKAKEAGEIDLQLNLEFLKVEVKTGAKITVSGDVQEQELDVSTGSDYFAKDLKSAYCNARLGTGANAEVYCTENLSVNAGFGSELCYLGKAKLQKSTFLGATVTKCN